VIALAERRPNTSTLLPLGQYDHVIVTYSGGKDSLACVLHMLDLGVPKHKIELWHQDIDGGEENGLMDWPVTHAYVKATGKALGILTLFQWRVGGFEREMLRNNESTAPVVCQRPSGEFVQLDTTRSSPGTRMKFPQVSADLSVRWCSSYLKIDVCGRAINNDPRLQGKNILVVTGERRQESTARSRYAEIEEHRSHSSKRRVDQWRPIIDWSEQQVWGIIERHRVYAHPAYHLGFGRVSCMACIFGDKDQWATIRTIAEDRFERIAKYERQFDVTIKRKESVVQSADKGTVYEQVNDPELRAMAMSREFPVEKFFLPSDTKWKLPAGAYKRCGGPI
jgi:3'-phosphoadenosine 5'-phosphosulfate sulfotransferase (PAPS reductase)/FAD synthetase